MKRVLFISFLSLLSFGLMAQTQNNPRYDIIKKVHFGFSLGTNFSDVRYNFSEDFYQNDTLNRVNVQLIPGITLGAIANFHLHERFDLRFIPSLLLTQRSILFNFNDNDGERLKTIESVYADIPMMFKYKSIRHNNVRFYVLGGAEYAYDIAAQEGTQRDFFDPNIAYKKHNFFWLYGCGFDLYFPYFKFSPEIRIANGINNILDPHDAVFSDTFSKLRTRMIMISFHFE